MLFFFFFSSLRDIPIFHFLIKMRVKPASLVNLLYLTTIIASSIINTNYQEIEDDIINPKKITSPTLESFHDKQTLAFKQRRWRRLFRVAINEVSDRLDKVFSQLKSFVGNSGFDNTLFEIQAEFLRQEISFIEESLNFVPPSRKLSEELSYIKTVFNSMNKSLDILKLLSFGGKGIHLVRFLVRLNLMLLALHNSRGIPDTLIKNLGDLVNNLTHLLYSWGENFGKLTDVPIITQLMFDGQFSLAKHRLESLKSYIQEEENPS